MRCVKAQAATMRSRLCAPACQPTSWCNCVAAGTGLRYCREGDRTRGRRRTPAQPRRAAARGDRLAGDHRRRPAHGGRDGRGQGARSIVAASGCDRQLSSAHPRMCVARLSRRFRFPGAHKSHAMADDKLRALGEERLRSLRVRFNQLYEPDQFGTGLGTQRS